MIVPDINILVYAYDKGSPFHEKSRAWWETAVSSGTPIGLAWVVVLGFVRLVTNPRVFVQPVKVVDALSVVDGWLAVPSVTLLDPGSSHWRILRQFLTEVNLGGKLVTDAHIAAIAREYRAQVVTNDRDFHRFSGIATQNPLNP